MNIPLNQLNFNLLLDLDTLLREGSVIDAARRLRISPSAMSRRLTRLRESFDDPLFVPAGRGIVPTDRALALKAQVGIAIQAMRDIFTPEKLDLKNLQRTFILRANDGFAGTWATRLTDAIKQEAQGVCLNFIPRTERTIDALRSGVVDLDIGVLEDKEPEIHHESLFIADFVGVARSNHPLVSGKQAKKISAKDLVAWEHVSTSHKREANGRLEEALRKVGLGRRVAIVAPGFQSALMMVASSDLVAVMPRPFAEWAAKHLGLKIFQLPVNTAKVEVSQIWHARHNADPAHHWLRTHVRNACL